MLCLYVPAVCSTRVAAAQLTCLSCMCLISSTPADKQSSMGSGVPRGGGYGGGYGSGAPPPKKQEEGPGAAQQVGARAQETVGQLRDVPSQAAQAVPGWEVL